MARETIATTPCPVAFRPRALQLAAALPPFILWSMLIGMGVIWLGAVAFQALSGDLITPNWRFPYLLFMVHLILFCGALTAVTWWRAIQGRSALWWHGGTFLGGVVFVFLLGIVGD